METRKRTLVHRYLLGALVAGAALMGVAQAQSVIEIHNTMSPGGSEEAALERFKELVEERSEGRFEVRYYMGGQLGDENAVLELLNLGQTQMALTGGNFMSQYTPEYNAISVPFLFPRWGAVEAFMDTPSGEALKEAARAKGGIVYLAPQKRAFRHMTANKEIHGPADLAGLKMRLPQIPLWLDVWETLGVQAVVIPAPDIYLAMRTGQVEAHENSLASPYTRQMWEVQDYIILTNHLSFPWHYVASERWWTGLSDEDRTMLTAAVEEARRYGGEVEDEKDAYYVEALKENGMTFIDVDPLAFRTFAMPAIERAMATMADGVARDVDAAIAATN
jgi:tripartite ATP-independent transporter DctP family solute receptor